MSKNKEAGAQGAIFDYLQNQNRPYSAIDIFNNLHKEYGKTVVTRVLEQLAQEKKIIEKSYGKQKIYFFDQKTLPEVSEIEITQMDAEILKVGEGLKNLEQTLKSNELLLAKLTGSLMTPEINNKIKLLTKENADLTSRLESLTKNKDTINPKEKDLIIKNHEKFVKEWRKRKRMSMDIIDAILEGYPKPKKVLLEEIGLETDEDLKVFLPK